MTLKQHGVHFVLCAKQGTKIEGVVLNRLCILGVVCPKQGQRLTYTQILPPSPPPPPRVTANFSKQLKAIKLTQINILP